MVISSGGMDSNVCIKLIIRLGDLRNGADVLVELLAGGSD